MREQEAKEIVRHQLSLRPDWSNFSFAQGYLQAIAKTQTLEEPIEKLLAYFGEPENEEEKIVLLGLKEALSKWQEEK